MTAPACGSCTAPVPDAYLCAGCTRDLAELLLQAASIASDLDDAIAKLLKCGSGGKRAADENPLPIDLAASDVRRELCWVLIGWAYALPSSALRPSPAGIAAMARWLAMHLTALRQHPRAAIAHREIRDAVHRALAVIDRKPERAPAGQCSACGAQLLAELGADEVHCRCGTITIALQDKRRERAAAADVLGTAAEISGAMAKLGIDIRRGTITSWASRGRLGARGKSGMYALSDVLALHAQSQARR